VYSNLAATYDALGRWEFFCIQPHDLSYLITCYKHAASCWYVLQSLVWFYHNVILSEPDKTLYFLHTMVIILGMMVLTNDMYIL
jgi:hypothetical protein